MSDRQREAVPHHDPIPDRPNNERAATEWQRYRAMMKWMALASAVTAGLALLYLSRSGEPMRLHMVIATIAGVGLTMLVGTGLMGLVFLSNRSGHDDAAARGERNDDGQD